MKKKIKMSKVVLIMLSSIIIVFTIYISHRVYNGTFEQYIFNLFKSRGTSSSFLSYTILYCTLGILLLFPLLLFPVMDVGKKVSIKFRKKRVQIYPIKNVKKYSLIIFILSLLYLGYGSGFFDYVGNFFRDTSLFRDYYVVTSDAEIKFPDRKKNLIYIFLESTETSNMSITNGGAFEVSTIPNLERLAYNNINFSNTDKLGGAMEVYGTGWTASSMIAQTSGIPFKIKVNDLGDGSTKFSNIKTLGDILAENGYKNYLFMGSDASFGGRDDYFENHNYIISDYNTAIKEGMIPSDYHEWWGYEDSKLFSFVKDKLMEISKNDEPFNLTLLTADTHFTDGYLDKTCDEVFDSAYANSFYCSDNMVGEFVEWVEEQDFYDDTVIVITGDHLTMQEDFYDDISEDYVRTIYNVFINVDIDNVNNKKRVFSVMDMFPTTLSAIGVSINGDRLGLGTNLFGDKKTIPEEIGIEKFNQELKKNSNYYYNYIRK